GEPGAEPDQRDDRRSALGGRRRLGLVLGRLERRAGRPPRPAVPVPPPAVRVLRQLCRRHRGQGGAPQGRGRLHRGRRHRRPAAGLVRQAARPQQRASRVRDADAGRAAHGALIRAIMASPVWNDAAIIVTYDEHGGFWDHVAPPVVDRWGPGSRVPAIVFSRFAKSGVDKTPYDTTAILKLIEKRWNLAPLGARDAAQADLSTNALNFAPSAMGGGTGGAPGTGGMGTGG